MELEKFKPWRDSHSEHIPVPLTSRQNIIIILLILFSHYHHWYWRCRRPTDRWSLLAVCHKHHQRAPNSLPTSKSLHSFLHSARGWNSWGIQATPNTIPSYPKEELGRVLNQKFIISQCTMLTDPATQDAGYDLCSLDGGWYSSITDKFGCITYNASLFDISALSRYLHGKGLRMGLYSQPGTPCKARHGTNVTVGSAFIDHVDKNNNCYFDYENPNTQLYRELITLWVSWGVDMIKLDYVTPGSTFQDTCMPGNLNASAIAYHCAIEKSGRKFQLDVSSDVCRSQPYWGTWNSNADSIRVDTDINPYDSDDFFFFYMQHCTVEDYRQFVNLQVVDAQNDKPVTLRGNLDNLFVGNPAKVKGVTDKQRNTLMRIWIGASSNLFLGSDMRILDDLGRWLITSPSSIAAADFCAMYPMQPRNPGTGSNQAVQLQACITGPSEHGEAYVLLTNLGPNLGDGGYVTVGGGEQKMSVTLADMGPSRSSANRLDLSPRPIHVLILL
uniref:Putative alpha-galactosidase 8 n=1 Tax=Emericella nidulans (strain FGSC A4 / ATCC 38163 / CBS 112.46 / NRRL 194 / M139) TaxID=227321 RepID=AGAL8_EMENI|nr:PUTATIVE PSEUDOGENE: RecName: Full=Putative alpha-galactosidase 8; AltName: Full=Alpha-D-galactoside galactohydrolase 8; AltName: Full=Melibiase 8; Flags: Precursor [Aspergillus nidulans FGSC A4]